MKRYKGWICGLLASLILLSGSIGVSAASTIDTDTGYQYLEQPVSEVLSVKIINQGYGLGILVTYKDKWFQYPDNREAVWNSSNPMVATVNQRGEVFYTGLPGQTRISAQIGSKRSEWVEKVECELQANSYDFFYPDKQKVDVNLYTSYKSSFAAGGDIINLGVFKWTSSNPQVATVNEKGKVTFQGPAGKSIITGTYQNLKVSIPAQFASTFFLEKRQSSATTAQAVAYFATINNSIEPKYDKVTYQTSNPSVATIDKNGLIKFTGKYGEYRITARCLGVTAYFDDLSDFTYGFSDDIDYRKQEQRISVQCINSFASDFVNVDNSKVTWKSSNKKIATVDSNGVIRFTGVAGSVTITAVHMGITISQTVIVPAK